MVSPLLPEKIEFVSEGTSTIPTQEVTYRYTNCSKIIRNAIAITGMNEYWINDLSQPQNSQSSFGTMKNGTKIGPTSPQTALAIKPNAMTARDRAFANAMRSRTVQ